MCPHAALQFRVVAVNPHPLLFCTCVSQFCSPNYHTIVLHNILLHAVMYKSTFVELCKTLV